MKFARMRHAWLRPLLGLGVMGLGLICLVVPVMAQSASPQEDAMYEIARELWCPLCAGVRLDACELQACVQMREEIMTLLAAGHDRAYIVQYFETQYGQEIHGEPSMAGFSSLAWLLPLVVLAALGVVMTGRMRRAARHRNQAKGA